MDRNNPEYHNWLAVGEALIILCRALRPYAEKKVKEFQNVMTTKLGSAKCSCPFAYGKRPNPHEKNSRYVWAAELANHHRKLKKYHIPWYQWDDPNDGYWEIAKHFMHDLGNDGFNVKDPTKVI